MLVKVISRMCQPEDLRKIFYPTSNIARPADIVSALVPIVQNSTSIGFASTLFRYVGEIANKRPRDIETICKALSTLIENPAIGNKQFPAPAYGLGSSMTFQRASLMALAEEISDGLDDVYCDEPGNLSIDSSNIRLTTALLSASAIKHNLQPAEQHIPINVLLQGLQDPDPRLYLEPEKSEIFGCVAIIHFAVVGDRICEMMKVNFSGDVLQALRNLKDKGVFQLPSSVKLLEVCLIYCQNLLTYSL